MRKFLIMKSLKKHWNGQRRTAKKEKILILLPNQRSIKTGNGKLLLKWHLLHAILWSGTQNLENLALVKKPLAIMQYFPVSRDKGNGPITCQTEIFLRQFSVHHLTGTE